MDAKKKAIKAIVNQPAWEYIEEVFKEEILEGKKPLNFKTEGKTSDIIAIEVIAREMSAKTVDKVLKKLRTIGNQEDFKKETYK